jgi:hypothetical protein
VGQACGDLPVGGDGVKTADRPKVMKKKKKKMMKRRRRKEEDEKEG